MITKIFDYGWGHCWPIKQFETDLINTYLAALIKDTSRNIVINSVWYGKHEHSKTCAELEQTDFDRIVLIAMLDAAIPHSSWFDQFGKPVLEIGYYTGPNELDFWALAMDQYFTVSDHEVSRDKISVPFMCLNRKPHWHRLKLYQELENKSLVDVGYVSMGGDANISPRRVLPNDQGGIDIAPNPGAEVHGIVNDIMSLGNMEYWNRHFLNVVTETVWDINRNHFVSEKIYKPMVGLRPFLVYDPSGAKDWLRKRGFEDYTQDFQDISDLDLSCPHNIPDFLHTLSRQSDKWFDSKFLALESKIMYNHTQFRRYIDQQKRRLDKGIQCQI